MSGPMQFTSYAVVDVDVFDATIGDIWHQFASLVHCNSELIDKRAPKSWTHELIDGKVEVKYVNDWFCSLKDAKMKVKYNDDHAFEFHLHRPNDVDCSCGAPCYISDTMDDHLLKNKTNYMDVILPDGKVIKCNVKDGKVIKVDVTGEFKPRSLLEM